MATTLTYELWDSDTGNIINAYDTEAAALAVVREAMRRHGRSYVDTLALLRADARGRSRPIAEGAALADRALAAAASEPAEPRPKRTTVPA